MIKAVIIFTQAYIVRIVMMSLVTTGATDYQALGFTWSIQLEFMMSVICDISPCMIVLY